MKDLRDKWVLITGAGSGIGRCLAFEFTRAGSNVILADINEATMNETAALVEQNGGKAICIRADVSRTEELEALAKSAIEKAGRVDVLVNNAGIALVAEMKDVSLEEWDRILAVNLRGPILLTHFILPHMISRNSGHIVNIASMAGLLAIPAMTCYTTTKFGLVGFSDALRPELGCFGIKVTVVCPGIVKTPIIDKSPIRGFSQEMRNIPVAITITPEKAAKMIVCAVRHDKSRVIPGTIGSRILRHFVKIFPSLYEFIIKKLYALWERAPI